ncbi:MAG: gliding motility-associated C-terminal domain-containing protein [Taibaiella sp.]|jgi:gliding motility-associated-like protein
MKKCFRGFKPYLFLSLLLNVSLETVHAQNPGGVSGSLTFWSKANTTTTGKLVLDVNNKVQRWEHEQSTFGIAQATAGQRPQFTALPAQPESFNFNPYVQFLQTASTFLNNTATTPDLLGQGGTIFMVSSTPSDGSALTYYSSSSYRYQLKPFWRTQIGANSTGYTADMVGTPTAYVGDAPRITLSWGGGATYKSGRNEGLFPVNNAASLYFPSVSAGLCVGRNSSGGEYVNSAIAEIILYNATLTFTEIRKVQSYLAVKYGITLDTTNYLASDATVIWDNIANSGFNSNITGIGRDDSSALYQKQSKSININRLVSVYNEDNGGIFPSMNDSNSTSFTTNKSFLLFGDNNDSISLSRCLFDGAIVGMSRTWKVQQTGTIGNVTLSVNTSDVPLSVSNLLVSSDPSFPAASTTVLPLSTSGSKKYASVAFNGNDVYFTFGSEQLLVNKTITNLTCLSTTGGGVTTNITGGISPYTYSWNTTPPTLSPNLVDVGGGTYVLSITHGGCTLLDTSVVGSDIIVIQGDMVTTDVLCAGEASGTITVTPTNGTPPYIYSLNGAPVTTSNSFTGLLPGLYNITITDAKGCSGVVQTTVQQPQGLELTIAKSEANYCERGAAPNGNISVEVFGGTPPYSFTINNQGVTPVALKISGLKGDDYTIEVTDKNGCTDTTGITIKDVPCCYLMLPTAFSPNGDGLNDVYSPNNIGPSLLNNFSIYDRWGKKVYSNADNAKGWDGNYKGTPCDAGTYYYIIEYDCQNPGGSRIISQKGDITLIR